MATGAALGYGLAGGYEYPYVYGYGGYAPVGYYGGYSGSYGYYRRPYGYTGTKISTRRPSQSRAAILREASNLHVTWPSHLAGTPVRWTTFPASA